MAKSRIIIADEDQDYIASLQFKFVTEFFNKIDLEIITDRSYFEELFSRPQSADVLIVSDKLYISSIKLHDIKNIFLLQEDDEIEEDEDRRISRIFKYSSLRDIFMKIRAKSRDSLSFTSVEKKRSQIITVTSAVGGIGKTTLAMGLAKALEENYKKALYIEASRLQTFQYRLDNKAFLEDSSFYLNLLNSKGIIYEDLKAFVRKESFSYIPAFKASLMTLSLKYSVYEEIAKKVKQSGDYDYIIVDAESCFDEYNISLLNSSDKVIVVTENDEYVINATNRFMENVGVNREDKYYYLINKRNKNELDILSLSENCKLLTLALL